MPLLIMEAFPKQHESFISPSQPSVHMYVHWRKSCIQNLSSAPPKTTITTKGYQLYDSAVRMLEIRNNLLENFTGVQKHMIDLAASTIPSSYLLPEILAAYGKRTRILIFTLFRQIVQSPSTASLTALWTWRWLDRIPAMSCVFLPFCQDELVIATPVTQHYLKCRIMQSPFRIL